MWKNLLMAVLFGAGLALLGVFIYYAILGTRCLAKKKPAKLNPKKEVYIKPPVEVSVSDVLEENKKRWLEKQAEEAKAWLNEGDHRPYAKVLQFPRKL